MPLPTLAGLLPEEIGEQCSLSPAFRGRQIFKALADGASSFDDISTLPLDLRKELSTRAVLRSGILTEKITDADGTAKLQITFPDGAAIETVLLTDAENRKTACVSCQAGCAMNCAFCKTGTLGFSRNLTAAEITEQFFFLENECGTLDNVVFMGMGEPLLNLGEIRKALAVLCHEQGRNLSKRRITVSTCGIIDGIYDLADNGPAVRLAISLTTADPALRAELMPVARANPLNKLRESIAYFCEKTGNRCTLEAALMEGVNTSEAHMRQLADFARGLSVHVNLIPWNPVDGLPFKAPTGAQVRTALRVLESSGVKTTVRLKRGSGIAGACGQLGRVNR